MSEREIAKLLALVEKALGASWLDISDWLREQNDLDTLEARVVAGDFTGVVQEIEAAAKRWAAQTTDAYTKGGEAGSSWLDKLVPDKLVQFDVTNERAVARAKLNQLEYVEGFKEERNKIAKNITHRALVEGQTLGENPRRIARDFRDSIGLTAHQEQIVANYRRALEAGDFTKAMGYELRDARSDKLLQRLRGEDDGRLTDAQIDRLVEHYRESQLTWRAENIARTESQRNVEQGLKDAFDQAVERGDIEADQLVGEWMPGPDTEHAREDHRDPDLLAQRPKHGEDFIMPDGTHMAHPGDPRGGAKHNAGCRCAMARTLQPLGA